MTGYLAISSFLNFLAAGLLAFAVVARGRQNSLNIRFGVFAVSIGCWSACYFLWQLSADEPRALFFTRMLMLFAYFVPVSFYHFIAELCGEPHRWSVRGGYAVAGVLAALNFTPLMVARVEPVMSFPYWPRAGELYWVYLVLFCTFTLLAGYLLVKHLRTASGGRATQLRNILIASIAGFGGGATNFPLWYDVPLPPVGNLLIFLYLVIMAHAVSRYQLPLVTYDFVHAAVYLGIAVTFAVFYLLLATTVGPLLKVDLAPNVLFTRFLVVIVITLFFLWAIPRLQRATDRILAQTYLRRRQGQQQALKEFGARIISLGSEQEIFTNLVQEIARAFNLETAAIYVRSEYDPDYQLRASVGWRGCLPALPVDCILAQVLTGRRAPLLFDGSEAELDPAVITELDELRTRLPFEAAFAVASDDFLSGMLLLGTREGGERYTEAELALLESNCLQVAVTLRARQLERRASQTEKLIALGTLAAGLAHEVRNPLTSIQTFSALLNEDRPDHEALREFGRVVQRDVSRIASIVENVAAFAESNRVDMTMVDLSEVLRTVSEIIRPELERMDVQFSMRLTPLPPARGNNSQLLQVFLNLAQNALQAMENRRDSRLEFATELRVDDTPTPQLCITIADNGPGIDPNLQPHIFEPFTTTKSTGERRGKGGMGLGLAIVKRIVQHHHGEIRVTSTVGRGTTFRVYLPPA